MPISDRLWQGIQALDGQAVHTIGRGQRGAGTPFTVHRDTDTQIVVIPSRGEQRLIHRRHFDQALDLGVPVDQLRPAMLDMVKPRMVAASYVVGILRELHQRGEF